MSVPTYLRGQIAERVAKVCEDLGLLQAVFKHTFSTGNSTAYHYELEEVQIQDAFDLDKPGISVGYATTATIRTGAHNSNSNIVIGKLSKVTTSTGVVVTYKHVTKPPKLHGHWFRVYKSEADYDRKYPFHFVNMQSCSATVSSSSALFTPLSMPATMPTMAPLPSVPPLPTMPPVNTIQPLNTMPPLPTTMPPLTSMPPRHSMPPFYAMAHTILPPIRPGGELDHESPEPVSYPSNKLKRCKIDPDAMLELEKVVPNQVKLVDGGMLFFDLFMKYPTENDNLLVAWQVHETSNKEYHEVMISANKTQLGLRIQPPRKPCEVSVWVEKDGYSSNKQVIVFHQ